MSAGSYASGDSTPAVVIDDYHPQGYNLTWSDEFEGEELDLDSWDYEIGNNNGWGNNELEYYTDHNETVEDGLLSIHAKKEDTSTDSRIFHYTSSRLVSRGKRHFTYGYMCARISLPLVEGLWPAFWMMPETGWGTEGHTWWPTCGEIDIMEAKGRISNIAGAALHYASNGTGGSHTYKNREADIGDISEFHVYAVEWTEEYFAWIYDGVEFFRVNMNEWNRGYGSGNDPFNKDFYFILNLAVGGNYDGGRRPGSDFESSAMNVDFVRCYQ